MSLLLPYTGLCASKCPRAKCLYAVNRDASELRRSRAPKAPASAQPGPMHVIYSACG